MKLNRSAGILPIKVIVIVDFAIWDLKDNV